MNERGFTLLETTVAGAILALLMGSALVVVGEMTYFMSDNDSRAAFALDSSIALSKIDVELREIGATTIGTTAYPNATAGGTELNFVRLADPACSYDGSTNLLWDPTVYTIKAVGGELAIWQGLTKRLALCRHVQSVNFTISGRQLGVALVLQRTDERGQSISVQTRRIVIMRN